MQEKKSRRSVPFEAPSPVVVRKSVTEAEAPPPMLEKKSSYTTRTSVTAPVEETVKKVPVSSPEKKKKNGADESVTDAIEMIKKMKKDAKKSKEPKPKKSGGGGGLGDMLGALPSSKKFKKQQKKANPMSSTMSVPAVPTQASIRQRNFDIPAPAPAMEEAPSSPTPMEDDSSNSQSSAAKRSSKGPSSSIKNRMSMFGGSGGGGMSFPSDNRFKAPSFTKRNSYTNRTSETKSPSMKPNTIAAALKRTSNGNSSRKLMEDDSYKNNGNDLMSQSDKSHEHTSRDKDLMAGMVQRPVRRNSFDGKKAGGRTSLRDRMKMFEQNIQKNKEKGQVKKIY